MAFTDRGDPPGEGGPREMLGAIRKVETHGGRFCRQGFPSLLLAPGGEIFPIRLVATEGVGGQSHATKALEAHFEGGCRAVVKSVLPHFRCRVKLRLKHPKAALALSEVRNPPRP
jgi:hypothetical protein